MASQISFQRVSSLSSSGGTPPTQRLLSCSQEALWASSQELVPTQPYEHVEYIPPPMIDDAEGEYQFPEIRFPPVSRAHDTAFMERTNSGNFNLFSAHGPFEIFIEDKDILQKHVVKYLDCAPYAAAQKVVGITRSGKYVIFQQAVRSCVPAAVSMIALDRGKTFLGKEITYPVTNNVRELDYIREAGFEPVIHPLPNDWEHKILKLQEIISKTGPVILHINHPIVNSHACVLDAVSWQEQRMTIRDPFHGRMLTIKLMPFAQYIANTFIQLK